MKIRVVTGQQGVNIFEVYNEFVGNIIKFPETENMKEWTRMYSKVCGNNESREYANSLMENGKYEMKEAIRIAYDRFFSK